MLKKLRLVERCQPEVLQQTDDNAIRYDLVIRWCRFIKLFLFRQSLYLMHETISLIFIIVKFTNFWLVLGELNDLNRS